MFDDIETDVCGIEFTATSIKTTKIKLNLSEKSNTGCFFMCIVRGTIKSYLSFVVEFVAVNSK